MKRKTRRKIHFLRNGILLSEVDNGFQVDRCKIMKVIVKVLTLFFGHLSNCGRVGSVSVKF